MTVAGDFTLDVPIAADGGGAMLAAAAAQVALVNGIGPFFVWLLLLIGIVIALFALVLWVKRWIRSGEESSAGGGFTLGDLRELHRRGEMTDEEFERAKGRLLAEARNSAVQSSETEQEGPREPPIT